MNRAELKEKAKKLISGNKWYLWKPQVYFSLIILAITLIIGLICGVIGLKAQALNTVISIVSFVLVIFETVFMIAYAKYCLEFVRGNKMDWKEIITFAKEHFLLLLVVDLLVALIVIGCSILFIIPGIIAAIGLVFYQEVCVDNTDLSATNIIKKSWNMTKGHKMDIFILQLSFIGWELLGSLTLGILYIWLVPYMIITMILAYEKLK